MTFYSIEFMRDNLNLKIIFNIKTTTTLWAILMSHYFDNIAFFVHCFHFSPINEYDDIWSQNFFFIS